MFPSNAAITCFEHGSELSVVTVSLAPRSGALLFHLNQRAVPLAVLEQRAEELMLPERARVADNCEVSARARDGHVQPPSILWSHTK